MARSSTIRSPLPAFLPWLSAAAMALLLAACGGGGGGGETGTPASASVTLAASPLSLEAGGSTTLTWSSAGVSDCTASGDWSGSKGTSGSETVGPLMADSTFALDCSGAGGSASARVQVTVSDPDLPLVTLAADPGSVDYGASTTLSWSSTNADACTASGDWSGDKGTNGSETVGPLTADSTFTLVCSGPGGQTSDAVQVTVAPPPPDLPTVTLAASPAQVDSGASATLSWSSTNADACTASGAWSGDKATSGSESTGPLTADSTFTLTCSGAGGSAADSVTVQVTAATALIEGLTVFDTANAADWSVQAGLAVGDAMYGDRSYTLATVPDSILGSDWIRTANDSKSFASDPVASFTLGADAWVVVAHRDDISPRPAWLDAFTDTGEDLVNSEPNTYSLLERFYTAGATVDLGPNGGSGQGMYLVAVRNGNPRPGVTLTASPQAVDYQGATTLSWSATDADACTASGDWSGDRGTTGSETTGALTADSTYVLTCTGPGGTGSAQVTVTVGPAPAPVVTLDASPRAVDYQGATTLSWSATDADACSASGAWGGDKGTTGAETSAALTADSTFVLDCTGPGGTGSASVTVTVGPPPPGVPTVSLDASPTTVEYNGSSTLTWATTQANTCTASGDWSGDKGTSGSESVGPLTADSTFTLTCNGDAGSASASVTVQVVTGVTLSGAVDSSLTDPLGDNRVYIYAGEVTPDDIDGDAGDPLLVVPAVQDPAGCTFGYAAEGLTPGRYTVAFTHGVDDPFTDDVLEFQGTAVVDAGSGDASHDFAPAGRLLRVGPGRTHATPSEAAAVARDGDVIEIDAGLYAGDVTAWYANDLTLRGVGGRAHLRADGANAKGKGIWVTSGRNIRVENIEFSGAAVPDLNGAGIRADGPGLIVCNGYFHDNENGILGGAGTIVIEHSEFEHNGLGEYGRTHNLYIDGGDLLVFRYNYSHHATIGHNLKSRAKENHILYNRIMDEADGNASYQIDLPNGGRSYIIGNLIQQSPNADNSTLLNYGSEGGTNPEQVFFVIHNTFVNDRSAGIFVRNDSNATLELTNNLFVGSGTVLSGPGTRAGNVTTDSPGFVDRAGYDWRLTQTSPARDAGVDPGTAGDLELAPDRAYFHPRAWEARPADGAPDAGAYEFGG